MMCVSSCRYALRKDDIYVMLSQDAISVSWGISSVVFIGDSKEQRKKWGYFNGDTTCECGLATENTSHMLQCTYNKGVAALKNDKAAGRDDILVEQLKHLGPKTHK